MFRGEGKLGFSFQVLKQILMEIFNILSRGIYERSINLLPFLFFFCFSFVYVLGIQTPKDLAE